MTTATPALAAALTAFVQRCGQLLAEAAPGEYDALFGVRQLDADITPDACWQREQVELTGASPLDGPLPGRATPSAPVRRS